ncbi:unnamed protein product, partial [Brenthis ino]
MIFTNKVVLISGAGSGFGEAIALHFANLSAKLSLIDINKDYLSIVADKCQQVAKTKVFYVATDVSDDDDLEKAINSTVQEFGRIDVLVNCAGIWKTNKITDLNLLDDFDNIMKVNLRAVVAAIHFATPALIESKGCIINISSVMSNLIGGSIGYNVSKAAVTHLTKNVAAELAQYEIRVNSISPGPVETNIMVHGGMSRDESDKMFMDLKGSLILKSSLSMEDIAGVAAFLASDQAKCITGSEIVVDSGFLINTLSSSL